MSEKLQAAEKLLAAGKRVSLRRRHFVTLPLLRRAHAKHW
jgi:hypothetical protein